jgi:RNA polymerase sigma-B factor
MTADPTTTAATTGRKAAAGAAARAARVAAGGFAAPAGHAVTAEELLRRRADLPAGHPGRAVLRTHGIEAGLPLARSLAARYLGRVVDRHILRQLLAALPVRERRILAMRFFGDLTQAEIALEVGVSQMHVSRLLTRALTQLRTGVLDDGQPPGGAVPARGLAAARHR